MIIVRSFLSRITVLAAGLGLFVSGCSTELDPNADYRETMVIYSVLNPRENVHFVKVTKAFLNTNTNAYTIAASGDSSYYKAEDLKVVLQKLAINNKDTSVISSTDLIRIDTTGKQPGTFFSGKQVLYRTQPGKPGKLDDNAVYRVVATNTKTGTTASGATQMVKEGPNSPMGFCIFSVSIDSPLQPEPCFTEAYASKYNPEVKNNVIRFRPPQNASIFTIKTEFHYTETTNGVTTAKHVEWYDANNFIFESTAADPTKRQPLADFSFYNNVDQLINTSGDNATTERKASHMLFKITAGSESLRRNFQANNSYSVFSQTRPQYDNIKNGAGLVGSRVTRTARATFSAPAELKLINEYPRLKFKG